MSTPEKQTPFLWPDGKKCAVSLTFDDARLSQTDVGIPLLDRYGIKATFYISPDNLQQRVEQWRSAAVNGHEIGNHTMTHPCTGNYAFSRQNALEDYSLSDIKQEIRQANDFIHNLLGIKPTSFAYPCGQKYVGRGKKVKSYVPLIAKYFTTGRGWLGEAANDPYLCDMAQLLAIESDGKSFVQLQTLVDQAAAEGRWLILAGHEMNESGTQTTRIDALEELCRYFSSSGQYIWVTTVKEAAEYISMNR